MVKTFLKNESVPDDRFADEPESVNGFHAGGEIGLTKRACRHPNISRQITIEAITPVRSAINPAGTACRVRRMPTEPK